MSRLIEDLRGDLEDAPRPTVRRKLRTIADACGRKRAASAFLESLRREIRRARLFTDPSLVDPGLRFDDWVTFSLSPLPPQPHLFPKEEHLRQLVIACLGQGVFRNLEIYRTRQGQSGVEYKLPNKKRIDLLCQERAKSGAGALVAIELKRNTASGTIKQLVGYLDALRELFGPREVRGIIVSGEETPGEEEIQQFEERQDIEWYCYRVEFKQLDTRRSSD